jgi:hypothetical protein
MPTMALTTTRITQLILEQLAGGEMRLLVLTVAVRKGLGGAEGIKGDLSKAVQAALRKLIASKQVEDVGGVYVLASAAEPTPT